MGGYVGTGGYLQRAETESHTLAGDGRLEAKRKRAMPPVVLAQSGGGGSGGK